ncbi:hypothetical protein DJ70_10795 [Halorubrum halodurans]|uniref:Glycosyltransferase subfamily 4-like N-terminal domain-containing protein n=2 Tax=Halorubrum halodurans TaxID=1383851 RepID=A0A256II23_9EURY|nr:hypothetical protein DJ70_10795 [Halorubrum halodurans]
MGGAHRWEKIPQHLDDSVNPHVLTTYPTFPFGEFDRRWRPIERDTVDGVPVTRLFTYQPIDDTTLGRILNYGIFSVLSTLYVICTFWRYDCIVTMSAPHTTFFPGVIGKLTGCGWVLDIFDLWVDNAPKAGYVDEDSLLYRAMSWLERVSFTLADAVIVITDTMGEYYEEKYPNLSFDMHVIPFGVDTELFTPDVQPTESTDVIYTGNLGTGQAFGPFLRGFAALDGEPDLMLVGGGARRTELEEVVVELGIEDRVTFAGHVDREEIPALLVGADVSFVPLKTEHQLDYARPTKLLETMAVGTPYVASAVAEIEALSDRWGAGFAVENDPEEVEAALQNILSDSTRREEMGEQGIDLIEKEYRWEAVGAAASQAIQGVNKR